MAAAEARRELLFEGLAVADRVRELEVAQLEAFERALELAGEVAVAAFRSQEGWVDGVRGALVALLELFDEEPVLARYLVVGSAQAGPAVLARREQLLERVAVVLDDERAPARAYPPALTAHAVASGVLGVLYAQLSEPEPGVLAELAGPLMSFMVMPFLGARAARRELRRPDETVRSAVASASLDLLQDPGRRLSHHREIEVLGVLAVEPGLSSMQVGLRAGIKDQGHGSRVLTRLARLGLIEHTPADGRPGRKAWRLTAAGEQLQVTASREARTPAGVILDLPAELAGRLDFWSVCVLRAVGEQPWLTSSEVAARAGVGPVQVTRLLASLVGLGLVDSVREAHRKGTPKVWQLTDRGRELDELIGRESPAPARSAAIDLMRRSGGRLSEPAVAVLRVSAAEPGLSNGEIAQRVGIADANSMSQLLARLAGRGLIENARNGGRENAWVLTTAGVELAAALRHDAPAPGRQVAAVPASRTVALDLLKEAGGRLNHRVVSVLITIRAEPGLSNAEICERLGLESKGHVSVLLARLARFGLIENQVLEAAPFQANAWRLTATGKELEATIRNEDRCPSLRSPSNRQGTQKHMSSPARRRVSSHGDSR